MKQLLQENQDDQSYESEECVEQEGLQQQRDDNSKNIYATTIVCSSED